MSSFDFGVMGGDTERCGGESIVGEVEDTRNSLKSGLSVNSVEILIDFKEKNEKITLFKRTFRRDNCIGDEGETRWCRWSGGALTMNHFRARTRFATFFAGFRRFFHFF